VLIGDSAYPLATYPTTWNGEKIVGWGFYIGGDTPHVWTLAEVQKLKQTYQYLLPIYTRSNPSSAEQENDLNLALQSLKDYGIPTGTIVQWDYETAVDSSYEEYINAGLVKAGYFMELYGSSSTVVQNQIPSGGYDKAAWTGKDYAPDSTADQFVDVGPYDLNDFQSSAKLWNLQEIPIITFSTTADSEDSMAQAMGGWCDLGWSTGQSHILQVSFDGVGGNQPVLRVVLHLRTGPYVLCGDSTPAWTPTSAEPTLEIPAQYKGNVYGVSLEPAAKSKPARYAAIWA
jgi:hypothetical protein